ncbi:hypothetical protein A1O3_01858 [Capronia epimyces CBS 606.96]|uniref:Uncharacterized protein n=1 Tax=Capronia epimyces CBS 606.96 TaxID=1182542 RepID=W9Z2Q0_9EURO|nr:uncharacterized protein A1O3_01858 [Capronia epimyces CBS 606.96]EXJ88794.1 hypothetical protein A1O3_01858 [Capronia epimyces CBS 606.96]
MTGPPEPWHLLNIPSEIRHQIWRLVFAEHHVVRTKDEAGFQKPDCQACRNDSHQSAALPAWEQVFRPLLTCKQIFREARHILLASSTFYTGTGAFTTARVAANNEVRRVAVWLHIDDNNRIESGTIMKLIGFEFPNLQHLAIHAHMRPPESYENLCDAIPLGAAIVRLERDKRHTQVTMEFDYVWHGVMFDSPFLGEITTQDSLEDHELVVRDLIEDDAFVEAALADARGVDADDDDDDEQAMTAALLRVTRSHERRWFEKLHRRTLVA